MPHDVHRDELLIASAALCCEESRHLIAICRSTNRDALTAITHSIEVLSKAVNGKIPEEAEPPLLRRATWAHGNGEQQPESKSKSAPVRMACYAPYSPSRGDRRSRGYALRRIGSGNLSTISGGH